MYVPGATYLWNIPLPRNSFHLTMESFLFKTADAVEGGRCPWTTGEDKKLNPPRARHNAKSCHSIVLLMMLLEVKRWNHTVVSFNRHMRTVQHMFELVPWPGPGRSGNSRKDPGRNKHGKTVWILLVTRDTQGWTQSNGLRCRIKWYGVVLWGIP